MAHCNTCTYLNVQLGVCELAEGHRKPAKLVLTPPPVVPTAGPPTDTPPWCSVWPFLILCRAGGGGGGRCSEHRGSLGRDLMAPHDVQAPGKASRVMWGGRGDCRAWPAPRPGRGRGGEPPPDPGRGSGWTRRALFLAGSDGSGDLSVFMCLARGPRVAMPPLPAASPSRVLSHPQRSERKSPSLGKGWAGSRSWSLAAQSSQRPTGRPGTPGQALQQGGSGARMVVRTPPPCLDPAPGPPVQQAEPETPHAFHLGPPQVSPCRIPQLHSRQVLRALPRPRPPHARPQMPQLPPTEHVLLGGGLGLGWAETCPLPPSSSEGCWD